MVRINRHDILKSLDEYDPRTGIHIAAGQAMNAGSQYCQGSYQPTPAIDDAPHEQEGFAHPGAAARGRQQVSIDDEHSSRTKMWDPVKECTSMGPPASPQPHGMASGYRESIPMGSQPFQTGHPYHHHQRSRQVQPGYDNISISPPHLRESTWHNARQSLESMITGATSMSGVEQRLAHALKDHSQNNGHHSMPSPRPILPHRLSPPANLTPSTERRSSFQHEAEGLHHHSVSATISQALSIARYAERLDQQSNYTEAIRAYAEACALFQGVIIWSHSFEERLNCDDARNTYQARLDVLLRESAAGPKAKQAKQDDRNKNDDSGRAKPQYTLLEDLALCHKQVEDLSWEEVAEMPVFKGKRKHRSLSQRKHTIGRMGPRYQEAEEPWTEAEDRMLRTMGDAGKSLGDIHRKFHSRNGERCLKRYFHLKDHRTGSESPARTSRRSSPRPAPYPLSTQHRHCLSVIPRHRARFCHSSASSGVASPGPSTVSMSLNETASRVADGNDSSVWPRWRPSTSSSSTTVSTAESSITHTPAQSLLTSPASMSPPPLIRDCPHCRSAAAHEVRKT